MNTLERILSLATESGQTNKAVEEATGLSNGSFSKWKKGDYAPSADAVLKLAQYFNVSTDYLFCLSDNREAQNLEVSLTEDELLLLNVFRSAPREGQFRIIQVCMNERIVEEKREEINAG